MPFSKPFKINKREFLFLVGIARHGERFHGIQIKARIIIHALNRFVEKRPSHKGLSLS